MRDRVIFAGGVFVHVQIWFQVGSGGGRVSRRWRGGSVVKELHAQVLALLVRGGSMTMIMGRAVIMRVLQAREERRRDQQTSNKVIDDRKQSQSMTDLELPVPRAEKTLFPIIKHKYIEHLVM
jgi:hypothetical protein